MDIVQVLQPEALSISFDDRAKVRESPSFGELIDRSVVNVNPQLVHTISDEIRDVELPWVDARTGS